MSELKVESKKIEQEKSKNIKPQEKVEEKGAKEEEQKAEMASKTESTQVDGQNEPDHKVLKHLFPWMK